MNHETVHIQTLALRKELADIHTANALHLMRTRRSQPQTFQHRNRLDRLQWIVEELRSLAGRTTGNASVVRETFAVRFRVVHGPKGPVLNYELAGPCISSTFSSQQYESAASLVSALSNVRLPGREIEAGSNSDRVYIVSAAQLEILNLRVPQ